eukprot:1831731-Pyramimonas_sp.AAC.1
MGRAPLSDQAALGRASVSPLAQVPAGAPLAQGPKPRVHHPFERARAPSSSQWRSKMRSSLGLRLPSRRT